MKYEIIYNEHTEGIIKDIEETFFSQKHNSQVQIDAEDICHIFGYIKKLEEKNERLKNQNNDLRKIYKNTYNRLFQNGNDELARYFQAQIDDCPTFYVEPIIDYASIVKELDKLIEQYSQNDYYYKYNGKYLKSEIIDDLKKLKEGKGDKQ